MSEKDLNKQAFAEVEKQLQDQKIAKVKEYILQTLNSIDIKKNEKARIEESLRILNLDLEDLRNGKFDKIEERNKSSQLAQSISSYLPIDMPFKVINWPELTNGTYQTQFKIWYF
jgi:Zn-dependent M16 (insulinase) family peptidase